MLFIWIFFSQNNPEKSVRMISEGSCDIEDWRWKHSFAIKRINNILQYIKVWNLYFKL